MAATSQAVAYSVGGTVLNNSSHGIKFAIYDFPWYMCDLKVRKAILMIIQRADRETGINVPFFKANIETFGSVNYHTTNLTYKIFVLIEILPISDNECCFVIYNFTENVRLSKYLYRVDQKKCQHLTLIPL
jgi:hypothetical protein